MRRLGLRGVIRGKGVKTTVSDKAALCPHDRVNRQFRATRPNALWVSDRSWRSLQDVELATLDRVHWFNHQRLLSSIGDIPPAEAEANYRRQQRELAQAA